MYFPADVAVAEEPQGEDGDEVLLVGDVIHFEAELIHDLEAGHNYRLTEDQVLRALGLLTDAHQDAGVTNTRVSAQ